MKLDLVTDKTFYKSMLAIVIPVALQSAINTAVNMLDTIMLGSFGEIQLSASSIANSYYSFYVILCMGIIGGCSVLVAQFYGAGEMEKARQTFSLAARMAFVIGLVFALITWFFPDNIMRLFTDESAVITEGVKYLKITAFIFVIHGLSTVISFLMRSVRVASLGLYVSVASFFVNLFANWVFIFGKFGMPRMEIAGAALGTLIARAVELGVTIVYVFFIDKVLDLRFRDVLKNPPADIMKKYFRAGAPALISDCLLGMGNTAITMVLGRMGAGVVAANSICQVLDRLITVVIQGVANAASILTGNTVGMGERDRAMKEGNTFYLISIAIGLITGALVLILGPLSMRLYNITDETIEITRHMMYAYSFITVFSCIQSVMTKGVLRGGGDTRFLMVADILFMWIVSIPSGLVAGPLLHGPGWLVIICLRIDFVIKSLWCIWRLKSGKWIRNVTLM